MKENMLTRNNSLSKRADNDGFIFDFNATHAETEGAHGKAFNKGFHFNKQIGIDRNKS